MKRPAIQQFHSGTAPGDAVTNGLLYTQKILRDLGFDSDIYAEHIAPELTSEIIHFSKFKSDQNNLLLLHHSMGHDQEEWILTLKEKIILVYHNITPPEFFPKDSLFYRYSIKGREQLEIFKKLSVGAIGDSQFNIDELTDLGFDKEKSKVIPLLVNYEKIKNHHWNHSLFDANSKQFNIIFVGRIAPNKCQHELIELFKIFLEIYRLPAKLFLVGAAAEESYERTIQKQIFDSGLEEDVVLTGKVSDEDLYAYYHLSDAFVCLSEHEGFGVPLIEAMIFDTPVIAYDSTNVKNTLGGSGILFGEKKLEQIAGFLSLLANNRALKREIIHKQRENLLKFQYENIKYELAAFLNDLGLTDLKLDRIVKTGKTEHPSIQIEGPFDSSYSLALINREMAKALNDRYPNEVALFSTEGPGDFEPDQIFLEEYPEYKKMWLKSEKAASADIVLRNLYPPRVYDAKGLINMTAPYGWEESGFPWEYICGFNRHLDALAVTSRYVQKAMIDNGLSIPAPVVGDGVNHILDIQSEKVTLKTDKAFVFLHISSCFPRKGVDVLLKAYCAAFQKSDDVCLLIKTFPNLHNNIEEQVAAYQETDSECPEIEIINEDFNTEKIVSLYEQCSCLVGPSRGEGYGLPMAEAMLFSLPVITTGYGGQVDFCSDETAWLIDYAFAKSQTHMGLFNSFWVEPDREHLSTLMKRLSTMPKEQIALKTTRARENILAHHKWEDCAARLMEAAEDIRQQPIFDDKKTKLGWVSTWNTKCGIAAYSKSLIDNFSEELFDITIFADYAQQSELTDADEELRTERVWHNRGIEHLHSLYNSIKESHIELLVIQFNFGFFNLYALQELIRNVRKLGIKVFITFHSTADVTKREFTASLSWLEETLKETERLFVHNISDLNILKSSGLIENVTLFPHGISRHLPNRAEMSKIRERLKLKNKKVIASYGFLLPHKGIRELIDAFALISKKQNDLHLLLVNALYPSPVSDEYLKLCIETIEKHHIRNRVTVVSNYLSDDLSFAYLSCADLLMMPYGETQESSSAAVRHALSTGKPVLCTPIEIFNDVDDVVHFCDGSDVDAIAEGLSGLLGDPERLMEKNDIQKRWIDEHDWKRLSRRFANIVGSSLKLDKINATLKNDLTN